MTTENAKRMFDAFYMGKRIYDQQPVLPEGVTSSTIHVLDTVVDLQSRGHDVRVSDISETLALSRPGITRTVKQMEAQGYLAKESDPNDGRVVRLRVTERGMALYEQFVDEYFAGVTKRLGNITDQDIEQLYRIVSKISAVYSDPRA